MHMKNKVIKKYLLLVGPIFFFIVSIKEGYIAMQYAELADLNIQQAISLWAGEIYANSNYTGNQLGTILRIDRTIYSLIIFGLICYLSFIQKNYDKKI